MIKSRRMRWVGHVACRERRYMHTAFWWKDINERGHFEDIGVDGNIELNRTLKK
jgi:hypothetical protein